MNKSTACRGIMLGLLLVIGCQAGPKDDLQPQDPMGNVTVYASNQSFETPTINILVLIDGKKSIETEIYLLGPERAQHNWKKYKYRLTAGEHTIEATTNNGATRASTTIVVSAKTWVTLTFLQTKAMSKGLLKLQYGDGDIGFM